METKINKLRPEEKKLYQALLKELKEWDLSTCEELSIKKDLAKVLTDVVKKLRLKITSCPEIQDNSK